MKRSSITSILCCGFVFFSLSTYSCDKTACKIYTIPKSGTFLLAKYFHILLKRNIIPEKIWHTTHYYEKNFPAYFSMALNKPNLKAISLIRDPRDMLCSLVNWLEKERNYAYFEIDFKPQWFLLSTSQKIRLLIDESLTQSELDFFYTWKGVVAQSQSRAV